MIRKLLSKIGRAGNESIDSLAPEGQNSPAVTDGGSDE